MATKQRQLFQQFLHLAMGVVVAGQFSLAMAQGSHAVTFSRSVQLANDASTASADRWFAEGLALYRDGQYSEAIAIWQGALASYQATSDRLGEGNTLGNLGIAHRALGNYGDAISYYQQALAIYRELDEPAQLRRILGNLGNVYAIIGRYQPALALQQESLQLARELQDLNGEQITLANLGATYAEQGDPEQAIAYYEQSLALAQTLNKPEAEAYILLNLGIAYNVQARDYDQAIATLQQTHTLAEALDDSWLAAEAIASQGFAYERLGEFEQAIAYYDQSISQFRQAAAPESVAMSLNNRAHAQLTWSQTVELSTPEQHQRLQGAIDDLLAATEILDELRDGLDGDGDRVAIFDTQVMTYNLLMQAWIAQGNYEQALYASELGRSRPFSRLLADKNSAENAEISLASLKATARDHQVTIVEYALIPKDDIIHQGASAVATTEHAKEIYIWVIKPNGDIVFRQQPIDSLSHNLEDSLQQFRRNIGVRSRSIGVVAAESAPVSNNSVLADLYMTLIEPIADVLPQSPHDKVVFIPQGSLFLVPFPALVNPNNQHLIEQHTVLTAPSIQVFDLATSQQGLPQATRSSTASSPVEPEALIVGNPIMPWVWDANVEAMTQLSPLAGAEQEANDIAALLQVEPILSEAASEAFVKSRIGNARVVHLATHGLLEYGDPATSGVFDLPGAIALAPGDGEDGLLTAAEILPMDLQAELVVLSACDTGGGRITGDGVIGLSRSFIAAGVPNVIVSLWSVPDAPTATLMTEFYRELDQGQPKAQALRQAMLTTMKLHPDPKDWAAFTLIGEPD